MSEGHDDQLHRIRHSAAHVMAQAVLEMFPEGKIAIGPAIEDGFYYDFDLPRALLPEDMEKIEARMREIVRKNYAFVYREVSADEARQQFKGQPYKVELINDLEKGGMDEYGNPTGEPVKISFYTHGPFTDLCRGPHVERTGQINPDAIKLMSIAGAYWRGKGSNPQLQRIYGTAWETAQDLEQYLWRIEEAKKRDHRKLGRELEIFVLDEEVGPGLPLWLPKGGVLIEELEQLAKDMERKAGYERVRTPHLTKESLFLHSGHLPYYAESMYPPMELEGVRYYMKPMNCTFHHKIFASKLRSYRELPLRLAEYGTCYRYEKSGELFGLMRVRSMQMNDAHIYVPESLFEQEFMGVVDLYLKYFKLFGIEKYVMRFSTHNAEGLGKKYVDNAPLWLKTEDLVRQAMTNGRINFVEVPGEAAFYGPKIDVQVWSAIGREFSLATNQVDFAQPLRFDLKFTNKAGQEEMPLVIHRAPLGTHERTIGFLLEHYAGAFPAWLSPVQAVVIPITDRNVEFAKQVQSRLEELGLRVEVDDSASRMQAKIREAQNQKIPYMLVVGDKEQQADAVNVRLRSGEQLGAKPMAEFITMVKQVVGTKSAELV